MSEFLEINVGINFALTCHSVYLVECIKQVGLLRMGQQIRVDKGYMQLTQHGHVHSCIQPAFVSDMGAYTIRKEHEISILVKLHVAAAWVLSRDVYQAIVNLALDLS